MGKKEEKKKKKKEPQFDTKKYIRCNGLGNMVIVYTSTGGINSVGLLEVGWML